MLIVAMVTPLLSGCPATKGSSAPPPVLLPPTPGDGRVKVDWTAISGIQYFLFSATSSSLTAFNWESLPNAYSNTSAKPPFYICGLYNNLAYYFAVNARINGGPGGASSNTVNETPYNASTRWVANPTPLAQIVNNVIVNPNIYGVGYASLTTCGNNATISSSGVFAAVGAGGAIFTSPDGQSWTNFAPPASFSTDLYAVTGYAAKQNDETNPSLRLVAVGAQGASIYSLNGLGWNIGNPANSYDPVTNPANPGNQALHSITQYGGKYVAVGDAGTIITSSDGITWKSQNIIPSVTPVTTANLNGITHGNIYVAVGDGGTIITSSSANSKTWTLRTAVVPPTSVNLRQVASIGNLIVAVGDSGTVVTSKDGGVNWVVQTISATNLVGVVAEYQRLDNDVKDGWLGLVPTVQFVIVDSSGNTYASYSNLASAGGLSWSTPASIGITNLNSLGQPLVSSGFGYVAAGNNGASAYAF
jgi:photosystem II stability/assembly factor-like uncharacterized protein